MIWKPRIIRRQEMERTVTTKEPLRDKIDNPFQRLDCQKPRNGRPLIIMESEKEREVTS